MSIITISRGSFSYGRETAEKLAEKLNYECISREVLLEASEQFHVPEIKLVHAIHDSPTILERFSHGKEKYVAYIRAALLNHLKRDNVIYHGFAGHFLLADVSNVLKVRIIADLDKRVEFVMKRDRVSAEKALYTLKKDDEERRKWSLYLYGMDPWDSRLYDLVFHIDRLKVKDAVDMISEAAQLKIFQATEATKKMLANLALAAQIEAELVNEFPSINISISENEVVATLKGQIDETKEITEKIQKTVDHLAQMTAQVNIIPYTLDVRFTRKILK